MIKNELHSETYKKVREFYSKDGKFLDSLQIRWMDEWQHEEPEEYKTLIVDRAKKHNLNVVKVLLNKRDFRFRIIFEDKNKNKVFLEILQTKTKIYA